MVLVGMGLLGAAGFYLSQQNKSQNPPPRQSASVNKSDSSKKVTATKKEDIEEVQEV